MLSIRRFLLSAAAAAVVLSAVVAAAPIQAAAPPSRLSEKKEALMQRLRDGVPVDNSRLEMLARAGSPEGIRLRDEAQSHAALTCATCQNYATIILAIIREPSLVNVTDYAVRAACDERYAKDPLSAAACKAVGKAVLNALPKLINRLEERGWDVPFNLCAIMFNNVCTQRCCTAKYSPEQVYISLADGKDFSKMRVTWVTLRNASDADVEFYEDGDEASLVRAPAEPTRTYTFAGWVGTVTTAVMTGLKPDTRYRYSVGSSSLNRSQTFSFRTFPTNIGTPERPARILYVADMAFQSHSDNTIARMAERVQGEEVDMVIHNGDISYADGFMLHWDQFMRKISPSVGPYAPYMTTPGNHENEANFSSYRTRLAMSMPHHPLALEGAMYYSVDIGPARLMLMDSETPEGKADIPKHEVDWANAVLSSQDRTAQPWSLVFHHRPLYCDEDSSDCKNVATLLRVQAESTYLANKVDMVVTGHVHYYLRSYPLSMGSATAQTYENPEAPVYVVNGAAGNHGPNQKPSGAYPHLYAAHAKQVGYSIITISADSAAKRHALTQDFYESSTNKRLDTFTINKNL